MRNLGQMALSENSHNSIAGGRLPLFGGACAHHPPNKGPPRGSSGLNENDFLKRK